MTFTDTCLQLLRVADIYWYLLPLTDTYWHLLTLTDTYRHVLLTNLQKCRTKKKENKKAKWISARMLRALNMVTISLQNDKYFSCFIDSPNWKEKDSIEPKVRNNPHFWSWQFSEKSEKFASFLPPKRNFSLGTNLKEFILLFFSILFFYFWSEWVPRSMSII